MGAPVPVLLRPLGVGEIIDRALTLYVRNFIVFTGTVLAVIFIPVGIGDYLLLGNQGSELQAVIQTIQHPNAPPPLLLNANASVPELAGGVIMLLIAALLLPFAINAVAINTAAIYRDTRPSILHALAATFRRTGPLIGLIALEILIAIGIYIGLIVLVAAGTFGVIASVGGNAANLGWLGVLLLVVLGIVLFVALFVLLLLFVIALSFAGYAVVIEHMGAVEALGSGFRRIFNRREWGKAALVGFVAMLLGIGVSSISSFVGFGIAFVPGSHLLGTTWNTLVYAASYALQTVFYAVYYYDVRIRQEGLDLEVALGRLAPSAP